MSLIAPEAALRAVLLWHGGAWDEARMTEWEAIAEPLATLRGQPVDATTVGLCDIVRFALGETVRSGVETYRCILCPQYGGGLGPMTSTSRELLDEHVRNDHADYRHARASTEG